MCFMLYWVQLQCDPEDDADRVRHSSEQQIEATINRVNPNDVSYIC